MGPVGVGAEAATTANLGADIYTYSVNEGAFIGASVEGAVIYPRAEWNHAYYGDPGATARGIVLEGRYANPQADALRRSAERLVGKACVIRVDLGCCRIIQKQNIIILFFCSLFIFY